MIRGTKESANSIPPGRSSSGVVRCGSGEKRLMVENTIEANGMVMMTGTIKSDAGVGGIDGVKAVGRMRGSTENLVRRSERPTASGMASASSSARLGLAGRNCRSGVLVCKASRTGQMMDWADEVGLTHV